MDAARIGRRIKAFRKLKGYTQSNFAKELNMSLSILGDIERGTREPSEKIMQQITELLHVDQEELTISKEE